MYSSMKNERVQQARKKLQIEMKYTSPYDFNEETFLA